jgi:hypothetical protein
MDQPRHQEIAEMEHTKSVKTKVLLLCVDLFAVIWLCVYIAASPQAA